MITNWAMADAEIAKLHQQIEQLTKERDEWREAYERCRREYCEFANQMGQELYKVEAVTRLLRATA